MPLQYYVHYNLQISKKKEAWGNIHRELIHLCESEITIQVYCIWYSLVQKLPPSYCYYYTPTFSPDMPSIAATDHIYAT